MARFILLAIIAFVAITFSFLALKGILRRFIGTANPQKPIETDSVDPHRVLYNDRNTVVLQGESPRDNHADGTT